MHRTALATATLLLIATRASANDPLAEAVSAAYAAHDAGPTEDSYRQLRSVYAKLPIGEQLNRRGFIAQLLERDEEALADFQRHVDGCPGAGRASCGEAFLADARSRITQIVVGSGVVTLSQPGLRTVMDSRSADPPVRNEYASIGDAITMRVRAGEHKFVMTARDGHECEWQTTVVAGTQQEYTCPPPPKTVSTSPKPVAPPPLPPPPDRENSWLIPGLVGGGAVAAGAAVGMYIQARRVSADTEEQFDDLCRNTDLDPRCGVGFDAADGPWRTGAAVLTGVAATAVLAGTAVYLWGEDEAPVTAWVSPMGGGLRATF